MTHDEFIAHLVIKDKKQARTWLWYARSSTWAFLFRSERVYHRLSTVCRWNYTRSVLFMVMTIVFLHRHAHDLLSHFATSLWEVIVSCFFLPFTLSFCIHAW